MIIKPQEGKKVRFVKEYNRNCSEETEYCSADIFFFNRIMVYEDCQGQQSLKDSL